jgi:LacI family transcriptional regulator
VLAAADELGYRPNTFARGLKTSRSMTIGVLVPDLTNPLFPPIVLGIDDRLTSDGYTPLLVNTGSDPVRERASIEAMLARQVDGFISATARLDIEPLAVAIAGGLPVVLVNRTFEDGSISACTVDDRRGSELSVQHMRDLGHDRIGYVAGPQNVSTGHRRYLGFTAAMEAAGLAVPAERVSYAGAFNEAAGARACVQVLSAEPRVTAIIAANDRLAIGCYDTLREAGLSCPEDVSVIGFNDMMFIDRLRPPLSSVRVPQREIGYAAADMLLEQLADENTPPREVMLEPTLVLRASTAPPPS